MKYILNVFRKRNPRIKPGAVVHICNPSYLADGGREIGFESCFGKSDETLSKTKKHWGRGSSGRVLKCKSLSATPTTTKTNKQNLNQIKTTKRKGNPRRK
jgi:hypothetical protein